MVPVILEDVSVAVNSSQVLSMSVDPVFCVCSPTGLTAHSGNVHSRFQPLTGSDV